MTFPDYYRILVNNWEFVRFQHRIAPSDVRYLQLCDGAEYYEASVQNNCVSTVNQSVCQPVSQSVSQPVNQSTNQSTDRSVDRSINPSIHPSVSKSVSQSINQSINQSNRYKETIDHCVLYCVCIAFSINPLTAEIIAKVCICQRLLSVSAASLCFVFPPIFCGRF